MRLLIILILYSSVNLLFSQDNPKNITQKKYEKTLAEFDKNDTLYIYIQTPLEKLQKKIKISTLAHFLTNLNEKYIQKGYLFNRIIPDSVRFQSKHFTLYYHLELNNPAKIDSLVYIGKIKPPKNVQKYLLRKLKNRKLNNTNLITLNDEFNKSTYLQLKEKPFINFEKGHNYIVMKLEKVKANQLSGNIGFIYQSKWQLFGDFGLKTKNIFNLDENLIFKWQKDEIAQNILLDLEFKHLFGRNLTIQQGFLINQQDSSNINIINEFTAKTNFKKHQIGINILFQNITTSINDFISKKFLGIHYNYNYTKHSKANGYISLKIQENIQNNNEYTGLLKLLNQLKIKHNFYLKTYLNLYQNHTENSLAITNRQTDILRNKKNENSFFSDLISLQNDLIYVNNKTNIYLIADYIVKNYKNQVETSYINTGIGVQIHNKNQILTFEYVKPFNTGYQSDYQASYINIKETIKF